MNVFLQHFLGLLWVAHHAQGQVIHSSGVPFHQFAESALVSGL